jgi:hypothetical protein
VGQSDRQETQSQVSAWLSWVSVESPLVLSLKMAVTKAGNIAGWYSACLTCVRPRA